MPPRARRAMRGGVPAGKLANIADVGLMSRVTREADYAKAVREWLA